MYAHLHLVLHVKMYYKLSKFVLKNICFNLYRLFSSYTISIMKLYSYKL